jgi:hypothetical protein
MMEVAQLLGNIGEFVGAIGVVATLVYLAIQVRHSAVLMENNSEAIRETSNLAKAAAVDRYSDAVSRWRGRLIESEDVARLWQAALDGEHLEGVERLRLQNLMIDWMNTYRSNFNRARVVKNEGLARQAIMSVVPFINSSPVIREFWLEGRPFNEVSAKEFVDAVEAELDD